MSDEKRPQNSRPTSAKWVEAIKMLSWRGYSFSLPWVWQDARDPLNRRIEMLCSRRVGERGVSNLILSLSTTSGDVNAYTETSAGDGLQESGDACALVNEVAR